MRFDDLESNGEGASGDGPSEGEPSSEAIAVGETEARSQQIEALRQHQMRSWWWLSLVLWLTVGLLSLWALRFEFQELREYFTWAAVRAMLVVNRLPVFGLGLCVGLTIALLYAESRHILFGLSPSEKRQLASQLDKIQRQGSSHPQWQLIHSAPAPPAKE